MPYKYIGRTTDFKGKTLWEILGNLKNLGVGRIIARNRFERYPEPSYLKILKVETLPSPPKVSVDNYRKVRVLVEKTFRGKTHPKPILMESTTYKPDYKLIPKDQEAEYCRKESVVTNKIYPKTIEFPPLLKELVIREMKARGENCTEEPKLVVRYNKTSSKNKYRIAEDGEIPNVNVTMGLGVPAAPSLYEGVKL